MSTSANRPKNPCVSFRHLSVLAYAQGFTLWHYRTDKPGEVLAPGFFNDAVDMLAVGDQITASGAGGMHILWVQATIPAVVVVPLQSAGGW